MLRLIHLQITVRVHLKSKCTLDMIYNELHPRSGRPSSVTLGVTLNLDRRGGLESKQGSNMGVSKYHNSEFDQEEGNPKGLQCTMKINI